MCEEIPLLFGDWRTPEIVCGRPREGKGGSQRTHIIQSRTTSMQSDMSGVQILVRVSLIVDHKLQKLYRTFRNDAQSFLLSLRLNVLLFVRLHNLLASKCVDSGYDSKLDLIPEHVQEE